MASVSSHSRGGNLHASRQPLSTERGILCHLCKQTPASLYLQSCTVWGAGMAGFMPMKPVAGRTDPHHSAQTLLPFYLGKHETAEPWEQAAPCQQLQQHQHLPEHPGMESQFTTHTASSSRGLREPAPLEPPLMACTELRFSSEITTEIIMKAFFPHSHQQFSQQGLSPCQL